MSQRKPKNLLLSVEAVERADKYADLHGTTVSRLVEDFLSLLPEPVMERDQIKSAIVRDLLGLARPRGWVPPKEPEQDPPADMDIMQLYREYRAMTEREAFDSDYRKA